MESKIIPENVLDGIAIIGISGRFPKAGNINQFWNNLIKGVDCIENLSIDSQNAAEIVDTAFNSKKFVARGGRISQAEMFDASFFDYNPREASLIDPQHRIFLECGWEAIEDSGYNVSRLDCSVGVFASCGMNHYLIHNILANPFIASNSNEIQLILGNDKDFLATRLSYKLNLRGPSYDIQTACSSSLVAAHVACQNLLTYQCDMALAGGVFLQIPWWNGYLLTDGDIRSADGICRPFDIDANGTVFGEGAGVVVLKRLKEALKDKDHIYAVIKGSAVNNDGALKAGYTAPSIEGQSQVIIQAIQAARIDPSDIGYIEAHGTGTPIGDPIEIAALSRAYNKFTSNTNFCALGSVKGSIGHLDAAAGITGLIKTALILYHKQIPPAVNFNAPNPLLKLQQTPFFINQKLKNWENQSSKKRYAAVSSLGVGGTNAHMILEEAPIYKSENSYRSVHFFPLSAKSMDVLEHYSQNLTCFLKNSPAVSLADSAATLQNGRKQFNFRSFIISDSSANGTHLFKNDTTAVPLQKTPKSQKIVFMFSGQGSQYINMGADLYSMESTFKETFDNCSDIVNRFSDFSLSDILYHSTDKSNISEYLKQTRITQPLLFSFEYALVKLCEKFGIIPDTMIGHSIGEYVAACVAGVFSLDDALFLVCERSRIMQMQPPGAMLSVNLSQADLSSYTNSDIEISVINAPSQCVLSGKYESLENLFHKFTSLDINCKWVNTSHAFHSQLMSDAVTEFSPILNKITKLQPFLPFISNVNGTYFNNTDYSDQCYWVKHLRQPVKFHDGIIRLLDDGYRIFIEAGPGNSLVSFVRSSFASWKTVHHDIDESILCLNSVRHYRQMQNDNVHFLNCLGRLWQQGINVNFSSFYKDDSRYKVSLPTYPFEKRKFWIEPVSKIEINIGTKINPSQLHNSKKQIIENETLGMKTDMADSENLAVSISSIWKELLGLNTVDPEKSFFESGGDSIWASQLLSRIRDKLDVEVPISVLYRAPSLNRFIEEILKTSSGKNSNHNKFEIVRSDLESGLLLSSAQLRLWFLSKLQISPAYNLATEFQITGPFKKDCALRAIDAIVDRHDVFRTTIFETENGPRARIHKRLNFKYEFLDFSERDCLEQTWINEIRSRAVKPYNFYSGPLLKILLICLNENHHVLSVMTHHIISDGWSMGVFLKEFSYFYQCFVNSIQPSPQPLFCRFADYANWQNKISDNHDENTVSFWKNVLSTPLPVLELPSFKTRPSVISYEGSSVSFSLEPELSRRLESLARNEQTTIFTVILGIYYILLSKYSDQRDIIIGSPVANRNIVELENLIGFFLNLIPFRIYFSEEADFKQLLDGLKELTRSAFSHNNIAFDRLVEIINPKRDVNHHPLFQVMFAYQNFPLETATIDNTTISPFLVDRGASEYDLSLYMWMEKGVLKGFFEYSTDLFEKQYIENMVSHFINLVKSVLDSNNAKIKDLNLLSPNQFEEIIYTWNKTDAPYPQDKCIHDLFKETAGKFPSALAVISEQKRYTYNDIDISSDRIALYLIKAGVQAGSTVGIFMNRTYKTIAALMGILKTGAAYVPLDPYFPQDRIAYMIEDAGLNIILTEQILMEKLPSACNNMTVVFVDNDIDFQLTGNVNIEKRSNSVDSLAYIIYTSGSTGKPKGVRITHRSVVNFLQSMQLKPGIAPADLVLASTTISFDISVLEIFFPLVSGASTAIIDHDITSDPMKLIQVISEIRPTIIQGTPSMWRILISSGWKGSKYQKILCGGEPLTIDLCKTLLPQVSELWNMYGPTESTVWATIYKINISNPLLSIGKPINNVKTYILNSNLNPVPPGVSGILYIGGIGLANGYHHLDDLTNQKFLQNPFATGHIYNTGDIARFRFDGNIDCLGRSDFQVKLRGYRIELEEIENTVLANSQINQCVATCKEFGPGDVRLVLYYTVKPDLTITVSDLRLSLKSFLPDYMIPQHFFELQSMPISPSGKINRKALIVDSNSIHIEPNHQIEPASDEEIYLARIWKQVLGIGQVTLKDNFFELGGHSLLSIKVINQIKKDIGFDIHPRSLMINTLEQIASTISIGTQVQNISHSEKRFSIKKSLTKLFKTKN